MTAPSPPSQRCTKCSGHMEFGILADKTSRTAGSFLRGPEVALEWLRGTPRKSWLDLSFKAGGEDRLQVATLRCTRCGYIELFAPSETLTHCPACNYDLTGLPDRAGRTTCPECGKTIPS